MSKSLRFLEAFIANSVLYCQVSLIDPMVPKGCSIQHKVVDLTAEIFENKQIVGRHVKSPFNDEQYSVAYKSYSHNESKLVCIARDTAYWG